MNNIFRSIVTVTELKTITNIDSNIQDVNFNTGLDIANNSYFYSILNSELTDYLINLNDIGASGQTTYEEHLIKLIKYSVSYATVANSLHNIHYRLRNGGVSVHTDSNKIPVESKDITTMYNSYVGVANYWLNEVNKYLEKNKLEFPLWEDDKCNPNNTNRNKPMNQLYLPKNNTSKYFK